MSVLVRNKETGEIALWSPQRGLEPVSPEQAEQLQQSRAGRFGGAFVDALQDSVSEGAALGAGGGSNAFSRAMGNTINPIGGAMSALGINPMDAVAQAFGGMNDADQAARRSVDPVMDTLGSVAAFGAELATPGLGVTRLPRSVGARIGIRAADDAVNAVARRADDVAGRGVFSVDDGARLADDIPQRPVVADDVTRPVVPDETIRAGDDLDSVGAQRNLDPSDAGGGERIMRGLSTPDELDNLADDLGLDGPLYTRGDRAALTARTGREMDAADNLRGREELARSSPIGDVAAGRGQSTNTTRARAEDAATQVVMRELGENTAMRLTDDNVLRLRDEIVEPFERAAREAGDLRFSGADRSRIENLVADASADDTGIMSRFADNMLEDIRAATDDSAEGIMSVDVAQQYRTELGDAIRLSANRGQYERAGSLGDLQDVLDDIVERQIPQETAEALSEARYRYRIFKALERSTATIDAGGQVNLRSFLTALERNGNRFGRSLRRGERGAEFMKNLKTLRYLTEKVTPNSGTADRLMYQYTGTALGALGGPPAVAGIGAMLSGD